jgi:holliday junction DNA helicase RuvB
MELHYGSMPFSDLYDDVPDTPTGDLEDFPDDSAYTLESLEAEAPKAAAVTPVSVGAMSHNEFRPTSFFEIMGQEKAKRLMKRMVDVAKSRHSRLDHVLLVGSAGTGKTTFANVIATEMGVQVYQLEAPISADTLLELREVMNDGDILFIDEVHQQAVSDRRGRQSSTQPEVLFSVMEDFTIPTQHGVLEFPKVTIIGATTDEGALPDPFVMRFPIRPVLEPYTEEEMTVLAMRNAATVGLACDASVARRLARASRSTPRVVNNYVKNAAAITEHRITDEIATEVLTDLNGVTADGLTRDMQNVLTFLYTRCRRFTISSGEVRYQASVGSIATAIGKSRDQKAIQLRVEPHLIVEGYLQVLHGGRALTDAGIQRAKELIGEAS